MSGKRRFIGSRVLAGLDEIAIDDRAVVERYDRLRDVMREHAGDAGAALFAEPVLSRSNGSAPSRIDWYTDLAGDVQPLTELDLDHAEALHRTIRAILRPLLPALRDSADGPLVAACLNLASPGAVLSIAGEPLLIDWGLLPRDMSRDALALARHHATTIGPLLPDGCPAPPAGRADWVARFFLSSTGEPVDGPALPPTAAAPARSGLPWAPVAAAGLLLALLALSYLPGVLAFPEAPRTTSPEARDFETRRLDGLTRQRDALASAGAMSCPVLRAALPSLVAQSPAAVRIASDVPRLPQARAVVEPASAGTAAGQRSAPDGSGLVDRLERGTVLVVAGDATGSGFFVTDEFVVTNRHVVEGAPSLMIAGRHVGIVPASLVRAGGEGSLKDFALLRVPRQAQVRPLLPADPGRPLTPVVAVGFPGLYLGTDPTFKRLTDGDPTAGRELEPVFQTGVVNHLQRYDDAGVTLVLHGAEIGPGNSGGPLVDYCGRVMGVNSFGRTDGRLPITARYALGSDGLATFLRDAGLDTALDNRACDLQTAPSPVVAATETAPELPPPAASAVAAPAAPEPPRPAAAPVQTLPPVNPRSPVRTGRDPSPTR